MSKNISDRLNKLSDGVNKAKESIAKAQTEAREKLTARRAKAHADATAAVQKVDQEIKRFGENASADWSAARAKVAADVTSLKSRAGGLKHDADAKMAEHHADRLERDAGVSIDYAIASVEQATLAALDAIEGRLHAQSAARS